MLKQEAFWFRDQLKRWLPDGASLLNIGAGTRAFRQQEQPYIHEEVIAPLLSRNVRVIHVDQKAADGVDVVGDVADPAFLARLKAEGAQAALCSNLLEHLTDRQAFCRALESLLPEGGMLFLSVPHVHPYHPDPLDTLFRPGVAELVAEFPALTMVTGDIIEGETWGEVQAALRARLGMRYWVSRLSLFIRLGMPFYKPEDWRLKWERERTVHPGLRLSAACVVLSRGSPNWDEID